jgi:predicted DNA-binding transcriptional regulator YafY
MQEALEVSRATLQRDLEFLRNRFHAPIVYDRDSNSYRYDTDVGYGGQIPLPGLWFNAKEIHALLTMQHLLAELDPGGLLAPHVKPLMARLNVLLDITSDPSEEIRKRVLLVGIGKRRMVLDHFEKVGSALLNRKRLDIGYYARSTDEVTERQVSPQRLVHYRENWYLDAWCHLRKGLRNFAVDSIRSATIIDRPAREVPARTVSKVLGPGYGIFTGEKVATATLRFTPERARWVATESWHPDQHGVFEADGRFTLRVPYADSRELLMDILKYGADCEVLDPPELRRAVAREVARMGAMYRG